MSSASSSAQSSRLNVPPLPSISSKSSSNINDAINSSIVNGDDSNALSSNSASQAVMIPTSSIAMRGIINVNSSNSSSNNSNSVVGNGSKSRSSPLFIPEILELIFLHMLHQFQCPTSIPLPHVNSYHSSSGSPASTPTVAGLCPDIYLQIRAQKPASTQLAFLRVCRFWYGVGEPLIWKNVKWADHQDPEVHRRIWSHWGRIKSLRFEYGKRTTDTEAPIASAAVATTAELSAVRTPEPSSATSSTTTTIGTTNRANGPRARMRNFLSGDTSAAGTTVGSPRVDQPLSTDGLPSTQTQIIQGRPRMTIDKALHELALVMSQPSSQPHYRPVPLPLRGVHFHKQLPHSILNESILQKPPLLHRSQLTSLTLTGLFRLETFLTAILPFVPELTYLDICLRCYEWRDEIRLDKVLRSCPKLQYLSVDRNMIGLVDFGDEEAVPSSANSLEVLGDYFDSDDTDEDDHSGYDNGGGEQGEILEVAIESEQNRRLDSASRMYSGTSWHLKYARLQAPKVLKVQGNGPSMNDQAGAYLDMPSHLIDPYATTDPTSNDTHSVSVPSSSSSPLPPQPSGTATSPATKIRSRRSRLAQTQLQQQCQLSFPLQVLKLKKVRMPERDFVQLLKRCPALEEMDVFSTSYWSWKQQFLQSVAQSCPKIKHLHLTTNYASGGPENNNNDTGAVQIGYLQQPMLAAVGEPYDPAIELIKLYPALLSYDARYVRFQDRALRTLQQNCPHLERLDLTSCRELSSKAVDWFLRHMPALKHFSTSRAMLQIEDMIEMIEEHDRQIAAATVRRSKKRNVSHFAAFSEVGSEAEDEFEFEPETTRVTQVPRWWACDGLETLIIGVKNPKLPGSSDRGFDLQDEGAADFQLYYKDHYHQQGSSSGPSSSKDKNNGSSLPVFPQYNHIQYCTFVFFEQLGRLKKLKRLELHGGRFDLGVQQAATLSSSLSSLVPLSTYPLNSVSPQQQPFYHSHSQAPVVMATLLHHQQFSSSDSDQMKEPLHGPQEAIESGKERTGSRTQRSLDRMKSFFSRGNGAKTKSRQNSVTGDESEFGPSNNDSPDDKDKGKGKGKGKDTYKNKRQSKKFMGMAMSINMNKGKGKSVDRTGHFSNGSDYLNDHHILNSHGDYYHDSFEDEDANNDSDDDDDDEDSEDDNDNSETGMIRQKNNRERSMKKKSREKNKNENESYKRIVPGHLMGLQPLAGLSHLESFCMTWSIFPMLREQEIAWICKHWTSLEWISLGLVPEGEWSHIRMWMRARRPDIIVIFER